MGTRLNHVAIVGVVAKRRQPLALTKAVEVVEWLRKQNVACRVDGELAQAKPECAADSQSILPRRELTSACDIVVVLGGDGTLISVARFPSKRTPTILGVNIGTLGFLNEVSVDELYPSLSSVLEGTARTDQRFLLSAQLQRKDGSKITFWALNDVVLGKETLARILGIEVTINDDQAAVFRGDGLIVSTPTGSTAYSLAAGGSLVHPKVSAMLLTPVCPHSLTLRPLVLPADYSVKLQLVSSAPQETFRAYLTVDGQEGATFSSGDTVVIKTSPYSINLVRSPSLHYFETIGTKLKWGHR